MKQSRLLRATLVLAFLVLLTVVLYYAKPFLVPVALAAIVAMLFLPLCRRLEGWNWPRGLASATCVLLLLLCVVGVVALISWQVRNLAQDSAQLEREAQGMYQKIQDFAEEKLGLSRARQEELLEQQSTTSASSASRMATGFLGFVSAALVDFVLMLVYILLFLYYRSHFKRFLLKLVPSAQTANTNRILQEAAQVTRQYLVGLGLMIGSLWILYSIGFSIVGLKNGIFFAILCGLLEVVPYVGNLTGTAIAALAALLQGGGLPMVAGVIITYSIVQFVQSYFLEPLVVGSEVNINPVFVILSLVAGELVWGIAGLVLALPLLAIFKIVCDRVEPLKPIGFLIGDQRNKTNSSVSETIKGWFSRSK